MSARISDFAAPLLPAGFYYKTFMWPAWAWRRWYEPAIRAMAGLGRAPAAQLMPTPTRSVTRIAMFLSLVPARRAWPPRAPPRMKVPAFMLCDEQAELGGSLLGTAQRFSQMRRGSN